MRGIDLPLSWYSAGSRSLMSIGLVAEPLASLSTPLVAGRRFSSCLRKGLRMMGIFQRDVLKPEYRSSPYDCSFVQYVYNIHRINTELCKPMRGRRCKQVRCWKEKAWGATRL